MTNMKNMTNVESIELEDLIMYTVLSFMENLHNLGCPDIDDIDIWFRELVEFKPDKAKELISKFTDILTNDLLKKDPNVVKIYSNNDHEVLWNTKTGAIKNIPDGNWLYPDKTQ